MELTATEIRQQAVKDAEYRMTLHGETCKEAAAEIYDAKKDYYSQLSKDVTDLYLQARDSGNSQLASMYNRAALEYSQESWHSMVLAYKYRRDVARCCCPAVPRPGLAL